VLVYIYIATAGGVVACTFDMRHDEFW